MNNDLNNEVTYINHGNGEHTQQRHMNFFNEKRDAYRAFDARNGLVFASDTNIVDILTKGKYNALERTMRLAQTNMDNDGIVVVRDENKHAKPVTTMEELAKLCGFDNTKKTSWKDFWSVLRSNKVLLKIKSTLDGRNMTRFFFNPIYIRKSNNISLTTFKALYEILAEMLPQWKFDDLCDEWGAEVGIQTKAATAQEEPATVMSWWDYPDSALAEDDVIGHRYLELAQNSVIDGDLDKYVFFRQTVMHGQKAYFYGDGYWDFGQADPFAMTNLFFTPNKMRTMTDGRVHRGKADVEAIHNVYIDCDWGKGADGKLIYDIAEVEKRKEFCLNALQKALPTPTAIVESRNGYHMYWTVEASTDMDKFNAVTARINEIFGGLNDAGVTKDAARVLRYPGSTHDKTAKGADYTYPVTIAEVNNKTYTMDSVMEAFEAQAEAITEARDIIKAKYPECIEEKKATGKKVTARRSAAASATTTTVKANSARLEAIAKLSTDTFVIPAARTLTGNVYDTIKSADLASFLGIDAAIGQVFNDIFREDNHASANIAVDAKGHQHYHDFANKSFEHASIIDIVMALANCDKKKAVRYICKVLNVKYSAKMNGVTLREECVA